MPVVKGLKNMCMEHFPIDSNNRNRWHILMVRHVWCFYFNDDASLVIHFYWSQIKPLKRLLCVIAPKKMEHVQVLQNAVTNLLWSVSCCRRFYTATVINWFPDTISVLLLIQKHWGLLANCSSNSVVAVR